MRRGQWEVYKRGAVVLVPLLGVTLFFVRSCAKVAEEKRGQRVQLDLLIEEQKARQQQAREEIELAAVAQQKARDARRGTAPAGAKANEVARNQATPESIAVDATHVYWLASGSGQVMRAAKSGGAPEVLAKKQELDTPRHAKAIAIDETSVYWVTSGTREKKRRDGAVMKVAKTGGEPVVLVADQTRPTAIVVQGSAIFWTTSPGEGGSPASGSVMKVAKSGGKSSVIADGPEPCALAADDKHVYWIDQAARAPKVNRTPRAGGETQLISASPGRLACSIGIDDKYVYWIDKNRDALMMATPDGSRVAGLALEPKRLSALVVDGGFVYSITEVTPGALDESGSLWKMRTDGAGAPVPLTREEPGLNNLAVHGDEVFWTRWSEPSSDGAVLRGPR